MTTILTDTERHLLARVYDSLCNSILDKFEFHLTHGAAAGVDLSYERLHQLVDVVYDAIQSLKSGTSAQEGDDPRP